MSRGKYIVFEGIDGSGKSTLTKALSAALSDRKIPSVVFPFPSRTGAIGKLVREVFEGRAKVDRFAMQYLMVADQVDFEDKIDDELADGKNVILDRHASISGFVYGEEDHSIGEMHDIVQVSQFVVPDMVFMVDVPIEVAHARRKGRGEAENPLYESDDLERLARLRHRYMAHVLTHDNAVTIDGTRSVEDIVNELLERIFS